MQPEPIKIDGFRMTSHLHTTVRQLYVCSEVINQIGTKQIPKDFLVNMLINWSKNEELSNPIYKIANGKITNNGKKTTAVQHYLSFCKSFGLIKSVNNLNTLNRLSFILLAFIKRAQYPRMALSFKEKLFYTIKILETDADGVLFILDMLYSGPITQKSLQFLFKEQFNRRLVSKIELASGLIKSELGERFRTINFLWQNADTYAEHLLAPRCEWLNQLGIVIIEKKGSSTNYSFSQEGLEFYQLLPAFKINQHLTDINELWITEKMFKTFEKLFPAYRKPLSDFDTASADNMIGMSLEIAKVIVQTSNNFQFPLYDVILVTCIELFFEHNCVAEFGEIINKLVLSFNFNGITYIAKQSKRLNESYIIALPQP